MVTRFLLFSICIIFLSPPSQAQILGPSNEESGKVWNIRFVGDLGVKTFSARARDAYQGEQFSDQGWQWTDWDTTNVDILNYYKVSNFRLGILVNLYKRLYVGVNYNGYIVQGFQIINSSNQQFNYVYWPFFSISGSLNYDYELPIFPRISLQPTFSVGTYQANPRYEGVGREFSIEGRMGVAFRIKKNGNNQLRAWVAYQNMQYRENTPSLIYEERTRAIKTDWNMLTAGIGAVFHIRIIEDRDLVPRLNRKEKKAAKKKNKLDKLQRKIDKKKKE